MNTIINTLEKKFNKKLYSCIEYDGKVYFSLVDEEEFRASAVLRIFDPKTNEYSVLWVVKDFDTYADVIEKGTVLIAGN